VLKKVELKERLAVIRKAFDKEVKDREALANTVVSCFCVDFKQQWSHSSLEQAVEQLQKYFKDNDDADVYIAALDVDGNPKVFRNSGVVQSCESLTQSNSADFTVPHFTR
jgi:alanyl-tRNA synthetase